MAAVWIAIVVAELALLALSLTLVQRHPELFGGGGRPGDDPLAGLAWTPVGLGLGGPAGLWRSVPVGPVGPVAAVTPPPVSPHVPRARRPSGSA